MMDSQTFLKQQLTQATKTAMQYFGKVTGTVKTGDNNQVLTDADIAIGKQLVAAVRGAFPDHNVIDEEAGIVDNNSDFTWVIDPIDGTSNFAAGLPHFGVMIGLLRHDVPIAGGIALPAFDEIYIAEQGRGAYVNGQKITVTDRQKLQDALVAYGIDGHQENPEQTRQECALLAKIVLGIRNLRDTNSAYDHCMVAAGRYGATLNQTAKIWDCVAPHILVEEAGGLWTAFDGEPMNYRDPLARAGKNFTFCAANPALHKQLQAIISTHESI